MIERTRKYWVSQGRRFSIAHHISTVQFIGTIPRKSIVTIMENVFAMYFRKQIYEGLTLEFKDVDYPFNSHLFPTKGKMHQLYQKNGSDFRSMQNRQMQTECSYVQNKANWFSKMWPLWRRRNCQPLLSKMQALLKGTIHPKMQAWKKEPQAIWSTYTTLQPRGNYGGRRIHRRD